MSQHDIRYNQAVESLGNHPFDNLAVADCGEFFIDKDVWCCEVYLDDPERDDLVPGTFTLWFEGNKVAKTEFKYI